MNFLELFNNYYSEEDELTTLDEVNSLPLLKGFSLVIIDTSGSMNIPNGSQSRLQMAAALAAEICERSDACEIYATSGSDAQETHKTVILPYNGYKLWMACKRAIHELGGGGIFLKQAEDYIRHYHVKPDRLYLLTDDQCDLLPTFGKNLLPTDLSQFEYQYHREVLGL